MRPIYERLTDRVGNRHKRGDVQEEPDSYKVHEDCWPIKDTLDRPHALTSASLSNHRKLIIYSEQLACLKAKTRERHLEKAQTELKALRQKLNKRKLITKEAIEAAKNKILKSCKVNGFMGAIVKEQVKIVCKKIGNWKSPIGSAQ